MIEWHRWLQILLLFSAVFWFGNALCYVPGMIERADQLQPVFSGGGSIRSYSSSHSNNSGGGGAAHWNNTMNSSTVTWAIEGSISGSEESDADCGGEQCSASKPLLAIND